MLVSKYVWYMALIGLLTSEITGLNSYVLGIPWGCLDNSYIEYSYTNIVIRLKKGSKHKEEYL